MKTKKILSLLLSSTLLSSAIVFHNKPTHAAADISNNTTVTNEISKTQAKKSKNINLKTNNSIYPKLTQILTALEKINTHKTNEDENNTDITNTDKNSVDKNIQIKKNTIISKIKNFQNTYKKANPSQSDLNKQFSEIVEDTKEIIETEIVQILDTYTANFFKEKLNEIKCNEQIDLSIALDLFDLENKIALMLNKLHNQTNNSNTNNNYPNAENLERKLRFLLMVRSRLDSSQNHENYRYEDIDETKLVQINMVQQSNCPSKAIICISENLTDKDVRNKVKDELNTAINKKYLNYEIYLDNGFTERNNIYRPVPSIDSKDLITIAKELTQDLTTKDRQFNVHFICEKITNEPPDSNTDDTKSVEITDKTFTKDKLLSLPHTIYSGLRIEPLKLETEKLQNKYKNLLNKLVNLKSNENLQSTLNKVTMPMPQRISNFFSKKLQGIQFEFNVRMYLDNHRDEKLGDIPIKDITSGRTYRNKRVCDSAFRNCTSLDLEAIYNDQLIDIECKSCIPGSKLISTLTKELANRKKNATTKHYILIDNCNGHWTKIEKKTKDPSYYINKILKLPSEINLFFFENKDDTSKDFKIREYSRMAA